MIRSVVEIISWSKFEAYEDRNLYYRGLADKSSLRKEYQKNMSGRDKTTNKNIYKMFAGYLVKRGLNYSIIPAEYRNGKQFEAIEDTKLKTILQNEHSELKTILQKSLDPLRFQNYPSANGEYYIISGSMQNKKHEWKIYPKDPQQEEILISEDDIENYKKDIGRDDKADLLNRISEYPEGLPCFYITWKEHGNTRISFGHTAMFRIAYEKSISEHIPNSLSNAEDIDITEAIFGKINSKDGKTFAGRIFFSDAKLSDPNEEVLLPVSVLKILASPKPTTFQHYLEQTSPSAKELHHYNSETNIRGYKIYWHQSGFNWQKKNLEAFNEKIETKTQPVKKDVHFQFRIRFENLSEIELGALIFALDLPEGCAHKIGMGKPLGLGSVKITSKVFIKDIKQRYTTLFDINNDNWFLAEHELNSDVKKSYVASFEEFILRKINKENKGNATNLWDTPRLKEYKTLLNVEYG